MSCEGCLVSNRGQQEQLNTVIAKAKEYAKEISSPVAIYKEGYEYFYTKADIAIDGHYNIVCVVSQYS